MISVFLLLKNQNKRVRRTLEQPGTISTMPAEEDTVSFDLGGTIFKVRRSLLEAFPSTMLARSASKEWRKDSDKQIIFIDRSAERFSYCLDYMRDGKVHLPVTQSKTALLNDMEYYGFEGVDPSSIYIDFVAGESVNCLITMEDEVSNEISQAEAEIKASEEIIKTSKLKVRHIQLAHACFREYTRTLKTQLDMTSDKRGGPESLTHLEVNWTLLDDCLKKYDLRADHTSVWFEYKIIVEPLAKKRKLSTFESSTG